ncbi:hypothetical protein GPJ56_005774 [Histomonas meleagridis]|uniref:uncharacterized protein n=1 Tax=Histomonas meleagridis TaxID=135588 RepID=UPI0035595453|nr:hypothetical protein GPJ56_005774 [Histomonas meleagridis]KAH0798690.1 hypothetical protein GO595_008555 [Histomonas meleagridis]
MDKVFQIADEGKGYLAVERSRKIVRQLLKDKKNDDAMLFLMNLSSHLIKKNQHHAAAVCANRAIRIFPLNSPTIRTYLKILFFQLVEQLAVPAIACPEFFRYCKKLSFIFQDSQEMILTKEVEISIAAGFYGYAQSFLINILFNHKADSTENATVQKTLQQLSTLLNRWIKIYTTEDINSLVPQYIVARCILMIASIRLHGLDYSYYLFNLLDKIDDPMPTVLKQPLVNFSRLYLKGLEFRSESTLKFLIGRYKPLLLYDNEISRWCTKSRKVQMHVDRDGDNSDLEGLMGLLRGLRQ